MRLGVIEPQEEFDYATTIAERAGFDGDVIRIRPQDGERLEESVDGIIVTGSPRHVYDRPDWIGPVQLSIRQQLMRDVPVLGICYGHQLVADLLGGTVEAAPEREFGYSEIRITEDDPLFAGLDDRFTSFTSHEDIVTELPPATTRLAENGHCIQAFRSEAVPAWGIQFHPEYDLAMAQRLLEQKEVGQQRYEQLRSGLTQEAAEQAQASRQVLANFIEQL